MLFDYSYIFNDVKVAMVKICDIKGKKQYVNGRHSITQTFVNFKYLNFELKLEIWYIVKSNSYDLYFLALP